MTLTSSDYDKLSTVSREHIEPLFDAYMRKYFVKDCLQDYLTLNFSSIKKCTIFYKECSKFFDINRTSQKSLDIKINEKLAHLIDYVDIGQPSNPFDNLRDERENRCVLLGFSKNGNLSAREIDSSFKITNWNPEYIRYVYKNRHRYIFRNDGGNLYAIFKSNYESLKLSVVEHEFTKGLNSKDNIDAFLSQVGFTNGHEIIDSIRNGVSVTNTLSSYSSDNPLEEITERNIDNAILSSVNALRKIEETINALKYAKLITKKNGDIKDKYEKEVMAIVNDKFAKLIPF